MNILYIGPYRQQDGWGRASKDYLKSLSMTKHNIAARHIWMGKTNRIEDTDADRLENVIFDVKPDVIIQNVLPYFGDYQGGIKNILQMYIETSPIKHTSWPAHMNLFDEIWVPTSKEQGMIADNSTTKSKIIPMPFDFSSIDRNIKPLNIPNIDEDDFIFYFIGEYIERKNLTALLVAFHREFKPTEKARLVIKTNSNMGLSPDNIYNDVQLDIQNLYKTMRLYNKDFGYIPETIITSNLSYADLLALHKRCDCLVMPSHGESTCRPVIEALAMGNQAIITDNTGMSCVVDDFAIKIPSVTTPVVSSIAHIKNLYTSHENWQDISILELCKQMRKVYDGHRQPDAREYLESNFSYETIAKTIERALND